MPPHQFALITHVMSYKSNLCLSRKLKPFVLCRSPITDTIVSEVRLKKRNYSHYPAAVAPSGPGTWYSEARLPAGTLWVTHQLCTQQRGDTMSRNQTLLHAPVWTKQ